MLQRKSDGIGFRANTYQALVDSGTLRVAHGLRVQPPRMLIEFLTAAWGQPASIVADRFRIKELLDSSKGISVDGRITRWSESSSDIRDLRRLCKDGPLSLEESSRELVASGLMVSNVKSDDSGNSRLVKSKNNTSRDDVPAAWLLVAGAFSRAMSKPKRGSVYRGKV